MHRQGDHANPRKTTWTKLSVKQIQYHRRFSSAVIVCCIAVTIDANDMTVRAQLL